MTATPLLDRVTHQADDDVARRLDVARATADAIRADGRTARTERRRVAIEYQSAQSARVRLAEMASARHRTSGAILEARARFLGRVFDTAEASAKALDASPDLDRCIEVLVADALTYVDVDHCRVRCAPTSREVVARAVCSSAALIDDPCVPPGAIVESDDGRVTIDATIVGQLRRGGTTLAIAALAALFEGT